MGRAVERYVVELLTRPVGRPSYKPVLRYKSLKTGGRWLKHARYYWLLSPRAPDPAAVWRDAAEDRGAAAGCRIRRVQSGADFDDDAEAQGKVSAEPLGKRRIAGRCVPTRSDTGAFRRRWKRHGPTG